MATGGEVEVRPRLSVATAVRVKLPGAAGRSTLALNGAELSLATSPLPI